MSHSSLKKRALEARRARALELVQVALDAVDSRRATETAIARLRGQINLDGCTLFAFGKAALPMSEAALSLLSVKRGRVHCFESGRRGPLTLIRSAHPFPASDAAVQGAETLALARSLSASDVALCLISGGGSSMLEAPRPGVSIEQIRAESARLMAAGADIVELNQHRRRLSLVKGGGLSEALAPATVVNIIISDTPGAPLETVASGPSFPAAITEVAADHLTMKSAVLAAAPELRSIDTLIAGEAREIGRSFAALEPGFVATGESTVTVCGRGRGGRNHELVLGAVDAWRRGEVPCRGLLLSVGSDGIDGSSDAAGAWCDVGLLENAPDPSDAFRENDAHQYFQGLGAQIYTGATGTNVADLVISLP